MDPQTVLGLKTPGLAPLAPLMKGADPAALVIESRRKIVDADEVPDHKKDDLRVALQTFGGLLVKDTQLLERLVWEGSMDLEESSAVQSWMRKGKVEGLKLGVQKGLLEARRGALLAVLSARFGKVEKDLEAHILQIEDPALLEELVRRAAVVPSSSQFFGEIP